MKCIKIVSTPPGEAPERVRQAWIGIVLPVAAPSKWLWRTVGVVSGSNPLTRLVALLSVPKTAGYGVYSATAIAILEQTAPEAAQWWRDNAPRTLRAGHIFVFNSVVCEEFDVDPWAFPGAFPQPSGVWPPPPTPPGATLPRQPLEPSDPRWDTVQQQAHRAKKKQQIQMLQTLFIVALATTGLMSLNHPVGPAYRHTVVIYDLSVLVVCWTGLLVTWWVGRKY